MTIIDNEMLWRQFGAAIDMFGNALRDCPDELWGKNLWEIQPDQSLPAAFSAFWYLGYHTLFWLDFYLTGEEGSFAPPASFDLAELEAGALPPRTYTKEELFGYLDYCRQKCQGVISALSNEQASRSCRFPWGELPYAELQLDNLRHVQEHGAQLRVFLGQQAGKSARWITRLR
jgi:hypothetical protein